MILIIHKPIYRLNYLMSGIGECDQNHFLYCADRLI
jgi:hypothetical protein